MMPRPERRKAYKASDPYATINRIRAILAECDLFTVETHASYPAPDVHCCRVSFGDPDIALPELGTNGKGLTVRYALASAYGELMERLQNFAVFPWRQLKFATRRYLQATGRRDPLAGRLERDGLLLDFHFASDEVYVDATTLVGECGDVLARLLGVEGAAAQRARLQALVGGESTPCVPYYSVAEKRVRLLPIELIWNCCGTNGMCAGNTAVEALVQGMSEIFERFVVRTLYAGAIAPPAVPLGHFRGHEIHDRICRLEETTGMKATVTDCSLGLGLPVVGLRLVDPSSGLYAFHVGSDPCPITALERCLTEVYQGDAATLRDRFHPLPSEGTAPGGLDLRAGYYATTNCGTGLWPESILADAPSYPFDGFPHPVSASDEEDLAWLVGRVRALGYGLFVRDVSFLGFPAFQAYVPGMSEISFVDDPTDLDRWTAVARSHRTLLDVAHGDEADIATLARAVAAATAVPMPMAFQPWRWFPANAHAPARQLSADRLLALLAARLGHDREAACEAFGRSPFPSCFDCAACPIAGDCRYVEVLRRVKRLQDRQRTNQPDQRSVGGIFRMGEA